MPTAAKLMGALLFALIGAAVALRLPAYLPEGMKIGLLLPITLSVSGLLGWRLAGPRSGQQSYSEAAATGLMTVTVTVVTLLLIFGLLEMLRLTQRMIYKGPMEAVIGIFEQAMKFAPHLWHSDLLLVMGIGGLLAGLACEVAGRRWP
ncbi:MAG: hypothetical protein CFE34_03695 [Rhodobacteraceae bacterium PARR1]|nr:MAG: hypothetical protein CFE34_03695 [Rhodobacteraceae bacterium PARR1]